MEKLIETEKTDGGNINFVGYVSHGKTIQGNNDVKLSFMLEEDKQVTLIKKEIKVKNDDHAILNLQMAGYTIEEVTNDNYIVATNSMHSSVKASIQLIQMMLKTFKDGGIIKDFEIDVAFKPQDNDERDKSIQYNSNGN